MSELPACSWSPNHGEKSPACRLLSQSEIAASSVAMGLRSTPKALPVGDVGADLLALEEIRLLRDGAPHLFLLAFEIEVGQLVHRLNNEGGRSHSGLENGEVEDLVRAQALAALHERVFDEQTRKRLRRVVSGRLFAVASGEPVDEASLAVDARLGAVVDDLRDREVFGAEAGDEPTGLQQVLVAQRGAGRTPACVVPEKILAGINLRGVAAFCIPFAGADLDQVFFGDKSGEGNQRLVDRTELADAELRVGYPTGAGARALERQKANDLLDCLVAQLDV